MCETAGGVLPIVDVGQLTYDEVIEGHTVLANRISK